MMFDGESYRSLIKEGVLVDATVELLTCCNLRCRHCYLEDRKHIMPLDTAKRVLDILYEAGTINLTFTGGEVFLHPDFEEIYVYAKKKGFIIEIKTNALLITEKWAQLFYSLPPDEINISVYGLSNEEYGSFTSDEDGFSKLTDVLSMLSEYEIRFGLHVICNTNNYLDFVTNRYQQFAESYQLDIGVDFDLLGGIDGATEQLRYRLRPDQILTAELGNPVVMELLQREYAAFDEEPFSCAGGVNKLFIDATALAHCCLFDHNASYPFTENPTASFSLLKKRNVEINKLYQESACSSCAKGLLCRKCPLKWQRVEKADERCHLAQLRREKIEQDSLEYPSGSMPKDYLCREVCFELPHMGLRERIIEDSDTFFNQVANYSVLYRYNNVNIYGNRGKNFFYLPALDEAASNLLNIPIGHALKILNYSQDLSQAAQEINEYADMLRFLSQKGIAPICYGKIALKLKTNVQAFYAEHRVSYAAGSILLALEVEHLHTIMYRENVSFLGNDYPVSKIQEVVNKELLQMGIKGKDFWLGNLLNTSKGIQLVDCYGWTFL